MKNESKMSWEYAGFITAATLVSAVGTDLTGRLLYFLYGEWPYVCVGLVVLAFIVVVAATHSSLSGLTWSFQQETEKKLADYEGKISTARTETSRLRGEIEFLRKSLLENWQRCHDTLQKAEKLLEQKTPIVVAAPSQADSQAPSSTVEPSVQLAVNELVGAV